MTNYLAIAYMLFVVQVSLGVAMIATASAAANRHLNAPHRSVDIALYAVGCASMALGVWAFLMIPVTILLSAGRDSTGNGISLAYVIALVYGVPLLIGGRLQVRVAKSLYAPRPLEDERKGEWRIPVLRAIGWLLIFMPFGMPLGLLAAFYFAIAAFVGRGVRLQQESLLMILAIAMRTQAPLAEEVDALADSSRGWFRRRLRKLAVRLRSGDRLSDALETLKGLAPPQTVTAIRVGEELGNVVAVIQQEAVRLKEREESSLRGRISPTGIIFYLFLMLTVMQGIVGFLLYWIVPKFLKIFQDFQVEPPAVTRQLITLSNYFEEHGATLVFWMGAFIATGVLAFGRRGGLATLDWGFLSSVYPRLETPGVLRNLAQAVSVRRPLDAALAGLELHHRSRFMRARIRRVRDETVGGANCYRPLARYGILSAREAAALAAAERAGNLDWALEGIADNIERRQHALVQLVAETIQPLVVIALGAFVFFVSAAFFFPLLQLLHSPKLMS